MRRITLRRWAIAASLFAGACGGTAPVSTRADPPAFDLAATRRHIEQLNERFTKAHLTGDVATIDAMFTPDAKSFPPGADAAISLPAIHALTLDYLEAGITEFREETTDFYGNAEYVIDEGTYVLTYGATPVTERGKYLNVWKQVDGSWKLQANIWNTNAAAVTPK
jgi:ketosteroid isomerase-like protein